MLNRCDVILVGTGNPENLGGVARLLANFGAASLTLVAPRVAPDDHRALVVGRAARDRLAGATIAGALDEAVGGCAFVVGFSSRRGADRPTVGLRELAAEIHARAAAGRVALVFGPEDTGLCAGDLDRCDTLCAIDLPGALASLNLAQAVGIALWEIARPVAAAAPARGGATRAEIEALLDHAFAALAAADYFRGEDPARKRVHLRRAIAQAALTSDEIAGLHGLCAQVLRALRH